MESSFHESWFKVEKLKVRLNPAMRAMRHRYRGEVWYVIQGMGNDSFLRINLPAWRFLSLLDGHRNVAEAWKLCIDEDPDNSPTQGEAISLLGELFNANLLISDVPPDTLILLKRYEQRTEKKIEQTVKSLLFAKIPLYDPDKLLEKWTGLVSWTFGRVGILLFIACLAISAVLLVGNSDDLFYELSLAVDAGNAGWLALTFVITKIFHEFGHAFACKHFGRKAGCKGEVHKMGIMLMVFAPIPFVDCTSSWILRSKWQRAFIGFAGMYFELFLSCFCVFIWAGTSASEPIHAIALNTMLVASVTTILFNGNPLLRYDAYYILSDLTEIPNLNPKSMQYLRHLVKRFIYGVKTSASPVSSLRDKILLTCYAPCALIYRIVIFGTIFLFLAQFVLLAGILMFLGYLVGMLITPAIKLFDYLRNSGELRRCRLRAWITTALLIGLGFDLLLRQTVADNIRIDAVAEPVQIQKLHMLTPGTLLRFTTHVQSLQKGEDFLLAENGELESEIRQLEQQIAQKRVRRKIAFSKAIAKPGFNAESIVIQRDIELSIKRLQQLQQELTQLERTAPFKGTWVSELEGDPHGRYLQRGQALGMLYSDDKFILRGAASQDENAQIFNEFPAGSILEYRLKGAPEQIYTCQIEKILKAGTKTLPSAVLGYNASGSIPIDASDQSGTTSAEYIFEIHATPLSKPKNLRPGQVVSMMFKLPPKSIGVQIALKIQRLFQEKLEL